jgi:hypothetical protein
MDILFGSLGDNCIPTIIVVFPRLVTVNLESRGYHQAASLPECQITSWSDIEDERERAAELTAPPPSRAERSLTPSRTLAPPNIHRLVNAWLYLVPDVLRLDEVRGSGYDQYVLDARRQVEATARACTGFDWPREAGALSERSETSSSDSRSEADPGRGWSEGEFLAAVLDQLGGCLDSGYDSNLQLTSVLSRLATLPHPPRHESLRTPTVPLGPGARSLYTSLRQVVAEAVARTEPVIHFPRKMMACR